MKIINSKCPNCGANLDISEETNKIKCSHCGQTLLIDDEKIKFDANISVDGIETNDELLTSANELLNMNEYLKAKKKFLEFSEKNPDNYQGWLGLLICRTRNFTIKDNNILFSTDVNKFYEHFLRTAPEEIKKEYVGIIENYLHPSIENAKEEKKEKKQTVINSIKGLKYASSIFLILGGIAFLNSCAVFAGFAWIIAGLILIPKIKDKVNLDKKKAIILSIVFVIAGSILYTIETPVGIEGIWTSTDKSIQIEFDKQRNVKLNLSDGREITGKYESKYFNNGEYIVTIKTQDDEFDGYVVKYKHSDASSKSLCTYENEKCTSNFKYKE